MKEGSEAHSDVHSSSSPGMLPSGSVSLQPKGWLLLRIDYRASTAVVGRRREP